MSSDNPVSAENQQERLIRTGWVIGSVDGEGCFSIGYMTGKPRADLIGILRGHTPNIRDTG